MAEHDERYYVRVFPQEADNLVAEVINKQAAPNDNAVQSRYVGSQAIAAALVKAKELNKCGVPPEKDNDDARLVHARRGLAETIKLIEWVEATVLYRVPEGRRRRDDDKTPLCLYCSRPKGQIHVAGCVWDTRVAKIQDAYGRSQ